MFWLLRALELSPDPGELKRVGSESNLLTFAPNSAEFWFGVASALQFPAVKVGWITVCTAQAFGFTCGFAMTDAAGPVSPFS